MSGARDRVVNEVTDRGFADALAVHARGSCDVILQIATVRGVPWADALKHYPEVFKTAAGDLLARIEAARERRRG